MEIASTMTNQAHFQGGKYHARSSRKIDETEEKGKEEAERNAERIRINDWPASVCFVARPMRRT